MQQLQKELMEQKEKTDVVERRNEAFQKEVRRMRQELKKTLKSSKSGATSNRFHAVPKNSFGLPCSEKQRELDQIPQSPLDHTLPSKTFQAAGWPNTVVYADPNSDFFHTHRDLASGADIINLAGSLNSEILQVASIITELCLSNPCETSGDSDDDVETFMKAREQTQITLGIDLVHALTSQDITSDLRPILLQIAMQAAMVTFCRNVIQTSSWSWQADEKQKILSEVYEKIREQGGQSTVIRIVYADGSSTS